VTAREEQRLTHWEGEPTHVWEALWEVPRVEAWGSLGSTNDRVRALAEEGAGPFTVAIAEEQTAGRGRGGKGWHSPPGLGLWISVLLKPPAWEAVRLSPLLVGLAACRAVERAAPAVSARLKWPNDVLLGERKLAGVLCEASAGGGLVAGVGCNVRHVLGDFPAHLRDSAVSLEMAAGRPVRRSELAGALLGEMKTLLARAPLRLEGALASEVARRDALEGSLVQVEGGVRGRARGIDASGRLVVEVAPGSRLAISAGSVTAAGVGAGARAPSTS
jgi:BirA family biotin operon repressor/biotin-[acetyl-CoA-carboxylase] ligase